MTGSLREVLRGLPVLTGTAPVFDPARAPAEPVELFTQWLLHAIDTGVTEPHAMTVSTVDARSCPSARVLIVKDVTVDAGWHFAVSSASAKGRELARNPAAALTFYWPALARQVRVCGVAQADPPEVAAADFLARPEGSRAMALTRRQSEPYCDPAELDEALDKAHLELAAEPSLVPDEWVSYAVMAQTVEFWQADRERRHRRLCYERGGDGWSRTLLWP
ncbi:MAG TPA: pyridoxal 5'-phosphate synthase [Mycobacterium sp.]|nr:pyridoxal 5'-phosphate synthase [Mycobacterium sp.]